MQHARRFTGAVDLFMLVLLAMVVVALVMVGLMASDGHFRATTDTTGRIVLPIGNANTAPRALTDVELTEAQKELLDKRIAELESRERDLQVKLSAVEQDQARAKTLMAEYQEKLATLDEVTTNDPRPAPTPR